jgi:Aspartyl/Asparaginyl beta-hydroxylase
MLDTLKLPVSFDPARLKADLQALALDDWVLHFNKPYYEGEWSGVALRSVNGEDGRLYPDPTARAKYANTPTLARCSYIQQALATFECELEAVRLLKLRAGSSIREHKDYNLGYEDGEVRFHVPVLTNLDVEFYLNQQRVVMNEGECWYLNLNLPHRVVNHSAADRIHLVIDCVVNDWMRALFETEAVASSR